MSLTNRNNHCSVTRCVYVQLVTHLLQLSPSVESAILSPLLHNMNDVLFGSTNKGMLLQEDILVSSAKLLFTASRCTTNALPHVSDLCRKCLLHQSSAVRQITLQFILDQGLPSIAEELTALVIQLFHTETEEGLLAVLCDILVKQKAQCTRAQEELCKVAMHHVTQPHLRYATFSLQKLVWQLWMCETSACSRILNVTVFTSGFSYVFPSYFSCLQCWRNAVTLR